VELILVTSDISGPIVSPQKHIKNFVNQGDFCFFLNKLLNSLIWQIFEIIFLGKKSQLLLKKIFKYFAHALLSKAFLQ